jgi:hypothetical protein
LTPQTVPTEVTPDVLGALGIGRTATIRKADHGIMGKDITDPAQAAEVKSILEAYRSRPNLSPVIAEKVDAYLARPEFQAVAPTETATQGETDVGQAIDTTGGTSVQALEPTDTGSATRAPKRTKRNGMVPAGADVEQLAGGEGQQAPTVEDQLAKYEGLQGATRAGAIRGEIANNNKVLELAKQRGETELADRMTRENERLGGLLAEAEARDQRDSRKSIDRQILGQAKSELDTAVANGELTQDQADKLVEEGRAEGNVQGAADKILEGVDKKPTNMFEQLVAREKNPDAPEVIAEGRKLKALPDDVEAFKEAFMEDLYKKKHPFDLPGRNLMGSSTPEARGAEATTNVQAALQEKAKAGDVRGALQAILDAPDGV